ncbi:hypothetical protein K2Y11_15260 [bacterium]|nr:hypothetical protein [bacterium]
MVWAIIILCAVIGDDGQAASTSPQPKAPLTGLDGKPSTYNEIIDSLNEMFGQSIKQTEIVPTCSIEEIARCAEDWYSKLNKPQMKFRSVEESFAFSRSDGSIEYRNPPKRSDRTFEFSELDQKFKCIMKKVNRGKLVTDITTFDGLSTKQFSDDQAMGDLIGIGTRHRDRFPAGYAEGHQMLSKVGVTEYGDDRSKESYSYLPKCLRSSLFKVQPFLVEVDGVQCIVISTGATTIWIDDNKESFAVRRWLQFARVSDQQPLAISCFKVFQQHQTVNSGVRFPYYTRIACFETNPKESRGFGKIYLDRTCMLDSVTFGEVADADFSFNFPLGTFIDDRVENKSYMIPLR